MKANQISISELTIYSGKNIYSHKPVMKMTVDIGAYGDIPTKDIPMFNDKLLSLLPGLRKNCCGLGYEGGFLDRLREGTYLGHVLEHVILEMQYVLGYEVSFGRTRTITAPSLYYLVYEYQNEVCGQECAKVAVFILNHLICGDDIRIGEFMDYLRKISAEAELGPSTAAIVDEAKKRGIPVTRIGHESLVRLGYGKNSRLVESTLTDATACVCADISSNKQLSKYLLGEHRIPVPYGKVVYSEISALMAANQIGTPVVVKPLDSNQGKGVRLNLTSPGEIREAFSRASKYSKGVIIEQFVKGDDYRVLVVGDAVRAVARRVPACVTGDGAHTVRELVDIVNEDPNRGEKHEKPLTRIRLDDVAEALLKKQDMTPETVVPSGVTVQLRQNGNISTGGTAVDCTDIIHPDNADLAVCAAGALGIDIAGIDIVTEDISKSILDTGGVIVEVNTAPGIRMHLYPSVGQPRNVAKDIVDFLFPSASSVRLPIVSVTGTNGKTTVARLIQHVLMTTGMTVGLTSTGGTFIGKKCIARGDNSGPLSARSLLSNKAIDAAVLETARGGIVREGLGYEAADVGVITNITEDHLGLDGVSTLDDLVYVKSLVAEAVREDGAAVLNALDPTTPAVLKRIKARPILFYNDMKADAQFTRLGCVRVYNDGGWIRIRDGRETYNVAHVREIPITLGGAIGCNIDNALAAAAALYGLGIPATQIKAGLMSFTDNAGRFELYDCRGVTVMLDYGHNPAGYETVLGACKNLEHRRLVGIIGMPGDRRDADIRAVGEMSGKTFDRILVKEDTDKRGREKGEVARLLCDAVLAAGFPPSQAAVVEDELEALKKAIAESKEGDLIVVFYEKLSRLQKFLTEAGAQKQYAPANNRVLASV
ncbi:cyanophycin synthetase [Sporobacter termitidis DSM 10068]|uniref:Cyanophycin synthetase n=1 Tax=Sporobacter termitidis DSM 10068 TaxID=1123282 RepID=A0A1M5YE97_9FIRM|nr:cyanophycin synthetase [Sporobacter termitidis]SHI10219.1 cyanophycin synthetase [Sporobacter termitidis DSM 10068]